MKYTAYASTSTIRLTIGLVLFMALSIGRPFAATPTTPHYEDSSSAEGSPLELKALSPKWTCIVASNIQYKPIETSYGFIGIGEGKQLFSVSRDGNLLWQKTLPGTPLHNALVTSKDFIVVVVSDYTSPNKICLYNPTGTLLWKKAIPTKLVATPTFGSDGRLYAMGQKAIVCLSPLGALRWITSMQELDAKLPLVRLNDGSLLAFHTSLSRGRTVATRLTPYGNKLEEVTFTNRVIAARETDEGLLVAFNNGTLALIAVGGRVLLSIWNISNVVSPKATPGFAMADRGLLYVLSSGEEGDTKIFTLNVKLGEAYNAFTIPDIEYTKLELVKGYSGTILLASQDTVALYSKEGAKLTSLKLPSKDSWLCIDAPNVGELVVFDNDWVIDCYKIYSLPYEDTFTLSMAAILKTYIEPQDPNAIDLTSEGLTSKKLELIESTAAKDSTKEDTSLLTRYEGEWQRVLVRELDEIYFSFLPKSKAATKEPLSFYEANIDYCTKVLQTAGLLGGAPLYSRIASIIKGTSNPTIILAALEATTAAKYDGTGELMEALKILVSQRHYPHDVLLMKAAIDAITQLCLFEGKTLYLQTGHSLYSMLMQSPYDRAINDYATASQKLILDKLE